MASVTFDGQSFSIDGRRIWLVSGAIHYPRVPRGLWRDRIRAAREAGLNCIETYVFWNVHEPTPGRFTFDGQYDLRAFVETIAEEGMWCMLRPGPYVCAEWDYGGLPAWLGREGVKRLRQADPKFLEASARYLGAVMRQVRDLQITTPTEGLPAAPATGNVPGRPAGGFSGAGRGPIVLMQAENEWFCHNEEQADKYLREIVRYLLENGCEVPIVNCNKLWQRVDGTIDAWNANEDLLSHLRQLAVVQPEAPRLVTEYWPGWFDTWGESHNQTISADLHMYRLSQILAAGGQCNLFMFHGGTNFGFAGSRNTPAGGAYQTTSYDYDAPLLEAGGRGEKYDVTKRVCTFASQFQHIFAHLDPAQPHITAALDEEKKHPLSLVHQSGTQGEVLFIFKGANDTTRSADVLLSNGLTMSVPMASRERVAWCLLNANLGGVARLDYTNLRPWAFLGRKMLVLFGPAEAEGHVVLDDVSLHVAVPGGKSPRIEHHDDLTVVVLSTEQVDATYIDGDGITVGAAGLDENGEPLPRKGWPRMHRVALDGTVTTQQPGDTNRPTAPRLSSWQRASLDAMLDGSDESFEKIDGPTSLEALHCDYGYGWYRIGVGSAKSGRMLAPLSGDRLHIYCDGKLQALLGAGPGAKDEPVQMSLEGDVVVLADNLGRTKVHTYAPEGKGLLDHIYTVKAARLNKPKIERGRAPNPFEVSGYIPLRRRGEDSRAADTVTWTLKPSGKKPYILEISALPIAAVLYINGEPIDYHATMPDTGMVRYVLEPGVGAFTGGQNRIKLALFDTLQRKDQLDRHVTLYQTTQSVTQRGQWAFQPWKPPHADAFEALPSSSQSLPSQPAWFRATFNVKDTGVPLWLEPRGMTKGQIILNGHNVGRYFMATREGKAVPPQDYYYLPEPWLRTDAANELLLFDEHGRDPRKSRLLYNRMGPYHSEGRNR